MDSGTDGMPKEDVKEFAQVGITRIDPKKMDITFLPLKAAVFRVIKHWPIIT